MGGNSAVLPKIVDIICNKIANQSMEKVNDVKSAFKTDIVMSLLKSRIQGLRSNRNNILTQMTNLRTVI